MNAEGEDLYWSPPAYPRGKNHRAWINRPDKERKYLFGRLGTVSAEKCRGIPPRGKRAKERFSTKKIPG
jgi:hypothetical protein